MKITFVFLLLSLGLTLKAYSAVDLSEQRTITCYYADYENRTLNAIVYGESYEDLSYADVSVTEKSGRGSKVIAKYKLAYQKPQGLSFIFKFSNEEKVSLSATLDDMSSLTVGDETYDLSCDIF